jgi:hypothetical protein
LVFYSGHGHLDERSDTGFWIPVNAGTDVYKQQNWLPHAQLRGLIANIEATHVLVISDSCFAGDLIYSTRSLPETLTAEYFKGAYSRVSRQVLTSGAVEVVPDDSVFSDQLISAFKRNDQPLLDALMLFNEIRLGVKGSTPLLGSLAGTGHQEGASFLLFLRDETASKDSPMPAASPKSAALPFPSDGSVDENEHADLKQFRRFSAGAAVGWMIAVGTFAPAFRTEPSPSLRSHYRILRQWGEIGIGIRAGFMNLVGRDDINNPFNPEPWDVNTWSLAASLSYTSVFNPLLYLTAELEAGVAINSIATYTPDLHKTGTAAPYLGGAIGVGLRPHDRIKIAVFGRFVMMSLADGVFAGIAPEISAEYSF